MPALVPERTFYVTLRQSYGEAVNRFTYVADNVPTHAQLTSFLGQFNTVVLHAIRMLQSNLNVHIEVDAEALDKSMYARIPLGLQGNAGGDCMPPYVCSTYRLLAVGRRRSGYKRFTAVPEMFCNAGFYNPPWPENNSLMSALTANIDIAGVSWTPAILELVANGQPVPVTSAQYFVVNGVVMNTKLGTQNTRKR